MQKIFLAPIATEVHQEDKKDTQDKKDNKHPVLSVLVALISSIAGCAIAHFLGPGMTFKLAVGGLAGAFMGLVPYLIAKNNGMPKLKRISMLCCVFSGMFFGLLLAIPVTILFTIIVLVKRHMNQSS